jgi:DNA-binding CsgD family transcriptional regulator
MREIDFLEACYRLEPDTRDWAGRLCDIAQGFFPQDLGIALFAYEVLPGWTVAARWTVMTERGQDVTSRGLCGTDFLPSVSPRACRRGAIRGVYDFPSPRVVVVSEFPAPMRALTRAALPEAGRDAIGLLATLTARRGVILGSLAPDTLRLSAGKRHHLTRLCEHLAAGQAVRALSGSRGRGPQARAAAVFSSEGRLLEGDEAANGPDTRPRLIDAVKRLDRARSRRRKSSPEEALDLWRAFVAGSYALVESFDRDGRRLILAVRVCSDARALTPRETAVVRLATRGLANKQIAGQLGVATSTVSVQLSGALTKLGCRNRADLMARASAPYWSEPAEVSG